MSTYEVRVGQIPDGMAARALSLYGETMVQVSRRVRTADVTAVAGHCLNAHAGDPCTVTACRVARTVLRGTIIPWPAWPAGNRGTVTD